MVRMCAYTCVHMCSVCTCVHCVFGVCLYDVNEIHTHAHCACVYMCVHVCMCVYVCVYVAWCVCVCVHVCMWHGVYVCMVCVCGMVCTYVYVTSSGCVVIPYPSECCSLHAITLALITSPRPMPFEKKNP